MRTVKLSTTDHSNRTLLTCLGLLLVSLMKSHCFPKRSRVAILALVVALAPATAVTFGPRGGAATKLLPPPPLPQQHPIHDLSREDAEERDCATPPERTSAASWFHVTPSRTAPTAGPTLPTAVGTDGSSAIVASSTMVVDRSSWPSVAAMQRAGVRLYQWYHATVPALVRYIISGNLGLLGLEAALRIHLPIPAPLASASFLLAYVLHIPLQHYLHAALVYGMETIDTAQKYRQTLLGLYSTLVVSGVGTAALHSYLQSWTALQHISKSTQLLWTLYAFALLNYLALTYLVNPSASSRR
jgi:hypothetical protein